MENNIIWLASYPKSGNTWFRGFLTALLNHGEVDINKMEADFVFSGKDYIENILDVCTDDLKIKEFELFRKIAFIHYAQELKKEAFIKVHDAYSHSRWNGFSLIPDEGTRLALYFIRNPLDVVLSLANHSGCSIDVTIDRFINCEEGAFIKKNKTAPQFYQLLGTWSMHVDSWCCQTKIPVHVIRYEDMKSSPFETFKEAVLQMQLNYSDEAITNAIASCDFNNLKEQEQNKGFKEKQIYSSAFFFKGEAGRWKKELSIDQIQKIMSVNEKMMKRYGYWEEAKKEIQ